jgi:hypothetical protein
MGEKAREEEKRKTLHQPTLSRQILYTLLVTCIYLGLVLWYKEIIFQNYHLVS